MQAEGKVLVRMEDDAECKQSIMRMDDAECKQNILRMDDAECKKKYHVYGRRGMQSIGAYG